MSAFFKQSSHSLLLGTLGTVGVSALILSGCATENPKSDSSSSASASASAHASSAQSSSSSPRVSDQGTAKTSSNASTEASAEAKNEATSSDAQKLEEVYIGSEEMKNASSAAVDSEEVKKITELVNSYENILTKVKAAPSPETAAEPTSNEEVERQNVKQARAVLDDETIRSIEAVAVDSAAAEFAVQASEYALAGWHYDGSSTVVGTPRMAETQYKGQPAHMLEVCMDSSSVKIYDENNQPVKDDNSPKRSLNIYTLVQVDGQWKIATHDFPNNADC